MRARWPLGTAGQKAACLTLCRNLSTCTRPICVSGGVQQCLRHVSSMNEGQQRLQGCRLANGIPASESVLPCMT